MKSGSKPGSKSGRSNRGKRAIQKGKESDRDAGWKWGKSLGAREGDRVVANRSRGRGNAS